MGLFDFLKKKDTPGDKIPGPTGRPECDIAKTHILTELFQTPKAQRDGAWQHAFYENVETASFACGNPQVITGPDGFPYFVLQTPEPDKPFESFCIRNMMSDFLLENGYGVVINPKENYVDWVFSYGDITNLHLNNEFFTKAAPVEIKKEEILEKEERILISQPSESYFPTAARQVLRSFLQHIGIEHPKMMMVSRTISGHLIQELAFNIFSEDFESTEHLNYRLQQISWFLPRHYIILSVPRQPEFLEGFADL